MREGGILFIWDRIGDYHLVRVKACEQILSIPVYTANLGDKDGLYKWENIQGIHHTNLSEKPVEEKDFFKRFFSFRKLIKEKKITTIALGYGHIEYIAFLMYARLNGIKTIVFCESWYSRGRVKDYVKSILLKTIGNTFFVSGKKAYHHFIHNYGISSYKIVQGYSVVDNSHFENRKPFAERSKVLLCIARFSEEKNLELLINAFHKSSISQKYTLKIVGDGPCKTSLEKLTADKNILLEKWQTYSELPSVYADAQIFILPSSFEPWGLVVNEAMAAGLPLIVSTQCGCEPDLLEKDKNGQLFYYNNEDELITLLDRWNEYSMLQLEEMGHYSNMLIQTFSPQKWATNINKMLGIIYAK